MEKKVKFTISKKVVDSVFTAGAVASSSSLSLPCKIILSLFRETELLLYKKKEKKKTSSYIILLFQHL